MKTENADAVPADFAEALRHAIAARDVTLVWLRDRLAASGDPVSLTTLSYWRSGRRQPEGAHSRAAVDTIEQLLGLHPGQLSAHLGPSRRTGPLPAPRMPIDDDELRRAIRAANEAVGVLDLRTARDLSTHVVVDVDEHGRLRRRQVRMLVQATTGTVEHLSWLDVSSEPTSSRPRITSISGARVTASYEHPNRMVRSHRFDLARAVSSPDTALVEWTTEFDDDYPAEPEVGHFVARPARDVLIWVRFHPDHLPAWCTTQVDGEPPRRVDPRPGHTIHVSRTRFGPGVLMVRWGFPSD